MWRANRSGDRHSNDVGAELAALIFYLKNIKLVLFEMIMLKHLLKTHNFEESERDSGS